MPDITYRSDFTVELVDYMGDDLSILAAMMVSTKGADANELRDLIDQDDPNGNVRGRIEFLMKNRHGTPFEHASMTFLVEAPIAVFREWHRHRIGVSYNEVSGRYRQLDPVFYVPPPERPLVQVGKPGHYRFEPGNDEQYDLMRVNLETNFANSYSDYEAMLEGGIAKEVARGVLPVYIYSAMYFTCNPRSLMAMLSLRTTQTGARSHFHHAPVSAADEWPDSTFPSYPMWEIEQCALKMEQALAERFPITHAAFRAHGSVAP